MLGQLRCEVHPVVSFFRKTKSIRGASELQLPSLVEGVHLPYVCTVFGPQMAFGAFQWEVGGPKVRDIPQPQNGLPPHNR